MIRRFFQVVALILLPLMAQAADPLPQPISRYVNDFANVLDVETSASLAEELKALRTDKGVEMTLVTLSSRSDFGYGSVETLATALFNQWGIGNKTRNDGILVLVLPDDREMRVELGKVYPPGFDRVALEVIDDQFLPAFRRGNYQAGIENGIAAAITRIALPHAEGRAAEPASQRGQALIVGLVVAVVAGVFTLLIFRQRIADRFDRCPNCNQRGQTSFERETLNKATRATTGMRQVNRTCRNCGYHNTSTQVIPIRTSSSSNSSFGGGSSSGGGASGRW